MVPDRRSSSAIAKYALALRRISLAWRSSRFSRSSALIRSRSSVVGPARRPWSRSVCLNPVTQGLARAADLGRDRLDGRVLGAVLALVVQHHPDRALADLRRIGGCALRHGSILSRVGASGKPGAVHTDLAALLLGALPLIIRDRVGHLVFGVCRRFGH